jgi:glucose-1-phosphate thymidylyltransferase
MKIIVPMAGRGSRLRPHTLTTPKPLVKVVGKPIVERLVTDLAAMSPEPIEEIAFVIGDFGKEVEEQLIAVAGSLGAKGTIYHQDEPLGTGHAIYCAAESMEGNIIVAFADTLFRADFVIDSAKDGVIWVQKVANPSSFGVVKMNDQGVITDFVEKPQEFVSDLAIIGIYYFKKGEELRDELKYLLDNEIMVKGEYQLTDALENMKLKGTQFYPGTVDAWLDCGNKNATVDTNARYMEFIKEQDLIDDSAEIKDSIIINPCYIGAGTKITGSVIGPYVSVGKGTSIEGCVIKHSMIQEDTEIQHKVLENSMIGNKVRLLGRVSDNSIGDFTQIEE